MFYLLFTCYLLLLCFVVNRISFIKNTGLGNRIILMLFLIKVIAGILCGWVAQQYYPQGNDYWNMNMHGWEEYQLLIHEPKQFFTNIFYSPYHENYGNFFNSVGSYWKDLANNIIIKLVALCDIFSRGNYYINSLFFNFFGFFGHVALYRVFINIYKGNKWPVLAGCFLLPSTLYFTSGLHKDNIVFTLLSLFCYAYYFNFKNPSRKYALVIGISAIFLVLIRNYFLVALIPSAIAMFYAVRSRKVVKSFVRVYIVTASLLVFVTLIYPSGGPLKILTRKQRDFMDLPVAASQMKTDTLQPTLFSFIKNTPGAVEHGFFRPYFWEFNSPFLKIISVELMLYLLLFCFMFTKPVLKLDEKKAFIYFGITLSVCLILFAGYIVPNAGSLVRYRSIYLPLLITPILCRLFAKHIIF